MYNRTNLNSKNNTIENNSIFNKINTNIITDYQRNKYLKELMQNQKPSVLCKNNIKFNNNTQIYLNGTLEPDENFNYFQIQRERLNNNKGNYNTNTNKNFKNRPTLNRYNSYGRMNSNSNNNTINTHTNKQNTKNKKLNIDNNRTQNKMQKANNHQTPISNKKKNIIPLGNNKYKTIGDNNNYSYFGNKIYNDSYTNRTFIQNQVHNTIDPYNLYSNKQNNITKKYNMKMAPNNLNFNYNTNNKKYNQKNNYNFKNVEISNPKRNRSKSRPKTPDFQKRGKSSSRFNLNNQRAKTPDRQRSKMKLNLNKEYLNTIDNKSNKKINHYKYSNRDYNNTIDNTTNNKYKNQFKRLNTNDYFKIHKKTINNYDYRETINKNNSTITSNNSHSRKYSYSKFNNNQQNKKVKKLTKNCSQGNILANNYNINLNSNGINHFHSNMNNNYTNQYHSNTNLVTPIKYANQKSNFKGEAALMTQIRAPSNYNIYDETFQSFGTNIPTYFNNEKNKYSNQNNNITERNNNQNNYFKLYKKDEREIKPNNKMRIYEEKNYNYQNKKEIQNTNYEIRREKNGNYNNTYIPATINNIGNKTYSYFNMKKDIKNNPNQKENINKDIRESNEITDIDFNDLDQFSPPYSKAEVDLTKNIDKKNNKSNNIYMNIGSIEDQKNNYYDISKRYDYERNSYLNKNNDKRKFIDDFINQLKSKY